MAEDRMLSDEILLALIKKNSGGGGGGTDDYNDLKNQPQINGNTLTGNKTASDLGLASTDDVKVKDVKVDNASCVDSNGNAIVAIQKSTGVYSYEISTYNYSNTKIVTKHDGVVTDTNIISYETAYTKQTIDDRFTLQYVNAEPAWTIELLIDSKDAPAGTKYQWNYAQNPPISDIDFQAGSVQVQLSAAYEELNNSIKDNRTAINEIKDGQSIDSFADVETALSGKQATLTFDDTPTDNSNNPVKSNGIYDALALKQNATDNSLDTDAKTIVGAINEHEGDIDTLKSGLTNYQTQNDLNLGVPNRRNLWNVVKNVSNYRIAKQASTWSSQYGWNLRFIPIKPNTTYTIKSNTTTGSGGSGACYADTNYDSINTNAFDSAFETTEQTFTTPSTAVYLVVSDMGDTPTEVELEEGTTVGSYTPYIPSVESRIEAVESGLTNVNNKRIVRDLIDNGDSAVTITFSGSGHTRCANMLLILATQAKVYAPISIMFTGIQGSNQSITSVVVSDNDLNVTTSGLSISIPANLSGWGYHMLVKLYPDDNIAVSVT